MYRQYELQSNDHRMTCWLDDRKNIGVGSVVTLRGFDEQCRWTITRAGRVELEQPPDKRWKVGGLQ